MMQIKVILALNKAPAVPITLAAIYKKLISAIGRKKAFESKFKISPLKNLKNRISNIIIINSRH